LAVNNIQLRRFKKFGALTPYLQNSGSFSSAV
jgi:hypothetical protein